MDNQKKKEKVYTFIILLSTFPLIVPVILALSVVLLLGAYAVGTGIDPNVMYLGIILYEFFYKIPLLDSFLWRFGFMENDIELLMKIYYPVFMLLTIITLSVLFRSTCGYIPKKFFIPSTVIFILYLVGITIFRNT